jgi:glycine/D-amino acid oxidase-like deaminating enzyme
VIGAGIIGAAIAYRLAGRGLQVVVFDRDEPGEGSTAASFALVSARAEDRSGFELRVAAMREFHRLAWGLAPAPWYHADGCLTWVRDPARAAGLRETVNRLRAWGYAAELFSADALPADLVPGPLIPDAGGTVAWFPTEAWVEAPAMTRRLLDGVRNAGGRILTGPEREVVAIGFSKGRVSEVTLHGGQAIPVTAVVNAAGAEAGRVAALAGRDLPVVPGRGLVLRIGMRANGGGLSRPVEADSVLLRPDGAGQVLLTSPEIDLRLDAASPGPYPIDDPLVIELHARGAAVIPSLADAAPLEALVGAWTGPVGHLVSAGSIAALPGYWEAVTGPGVTLAPLIGRSLADEMLGKEGNPLLHPFQPDAALV